MTNYCWGALWQSCGALQWLYGADDNDVAVVKRNATAIGVGDGRRTNGGLVRLVRRHRIVISRQRMQVVGSTFTNYSVYTLIGV